MPYDPSDPWRQETSTRAISTTTMSPALARVIYGRRAAKTLVTKLLTWPWRTEKGGVVCMGVAVGATILGLFINPAWFLLGAVANVPWMVQGLATAFDAIERSGRAVFDNEIQELAYKDGVTIDYTQEEESKP